MSCQDVVSAAQKCLDNGQIQGLSIVIIPAAYCYELRDALETYKKEKRFVSGRQVMEEYTDYEPTITSS